MYGGFWMSFGTIFIPGSGIIDSYITNGVLNAAELDSALGIYLWTWFIVTFLLLCVDLSLHVSVALGASGFVVALWHACSHLVAAPSFSLMAGQDFALYGVGLTYGGFSVVGPLCVPDWDVNVNGWRNSLLR